MTVTTTQYTMVTYFIYDSEKEYSLNMEITITNLRQKGAKKIRERVMVSTHLMSRLSPCSNMLPGSQMMFLCGVFLQQ